MRDNEEVLSNAYIAYTAAKDSEEAVLLRGRGLHLNPPEKAPARQLPISASTAQQQRGSEG